MVERGSRARLADKPLNVRRGHFRGRQQLESDFPTKPRIDGLVNLAHAAGAKKLHDAIRSDELTRSEPGVLHTDWHSRRCIACAPLTGSFEEVVDSMPQLLVLTKGVAQHALACIGEPFSHLEFRLQPTRPATVMCEKRLDVLTQFAIGRTGLIEERAPLARLTLRRRIEHLFATLPSLRGHETRPRSSSRRSHPLAMRQSRLTVRGEILN